jgi:glycosyltransferase involved in cell wall biosynthesis
VGGDPGVTGQPSVRVPSVLVDASNLHEGGALQVAASFLDEVAELSTDPDKLARWPWLSDVRVEASSEVLANVSPTTRRRLRCVEHNRRPGDLRRWLARGARYDVSFVVFGPEYGRARATRSLVGYADVTSIYPLPRGMPRPGVGQAIRTQVRSRLSRRLTRRADVVVVETTAMAKRLHAGAGIPMRRIRVVPNTYNRVFDQPERWEVPFVLPQPRPTEQRLAYVTRGYAHKNLDFLGAVSEVSRDEHGMDLTFLLTLTSKEWAERASSLKRAAINLGPQSLTRIPRVYEACDAAVFPSLLEAFSAMPLEAMRMEKPLFASDRDFNRSVCGEAADYFDPLDARAAARTITQGLRDPGRILRKVAAGNLVVDALPSARQRALSYLSLTDELLADPR